MGTTEAPIEVRIDAVTFSDGTRLELPPNGVTVFVGPNNVGKSAALREIRAFLGSGAPRPLVLSNVDLHRRGGVYELQSWLNEHAQRVLQSTAWVYQRAGGLASEVLLRQYWENPRALGDLASLMVFCADAGSRLDAAKPAKSFDLVNDPPLHPLHHLYKDPALEARLSHIVEYAFGQQVVINRWGGSMIHLHVGTPPKGEHGSAAPSANFLQQLKQLPTLENQGDGMKSFIGLFMFLLAEDHFLLLIDEPEAFLHPPQARLLGRTLLTEKPANTQVVLATHDSDILKGILDAPDTDVMIVRLEREGDVNVPSPLDPTRVRELWSDPLLRYSNVLDGLFHRLVVVCEGDADSRFYGSILNSLPGDVVGTLGSEVLFTHCGGKHRIPMVVESLRAVNVPVRVIVDIDIFREWAVLAQLIENLGGKPASLQDEWKTLTATLNGMGKEPSSAYTKEKLIEILDARIPAPLQDSDREAARQLLRRVSGWDQVKAGGLGAVPQGRAYASAESLLASLRDLGVFVVPVGELERFAPMVPGHGPSWVTELHNRKLHFDAALDPARDFVRQVIGV